MKNDNDDFFLYYHQVPGTVPGTQRRELILYEFSVGFKYYRLLSYYKLLSCDPGMYGYQEWNQYLVYQRVIKWGGSLLGLVAVCSYNLNSRSNINNIYNNSRTNLFQSHHARDLRSS